MTTKNRIGLAFAVTTYFLGFMRLFQYMFYDGLSFWQTIIIDDVWLSLLHGAIFTYTLTSDKKYMYYIQVILLSFQSVYMLISNSVDQFSIVVVVLSVRLALKYGLYKDNFKLKMVFTIIMLFVMVLFIGVMNGADFLGSVLIQKYIAFWVFAVILFLLIEIDPSTLHVNKGMVYEDKTNKIIKEQRALNKEMQLTLAKTLNEISELKLRLHREDKHG